MVTKTNSSAVATHLEYKALGYPLRRQSPFICDHDIAILIKIGTCQHHMLRSVCKYSVPVADIEDDDKTRCCCHKTLVYVRTRLSIFQGIDIPKWLRR